jgi:hypothetical protein
MKFEMLVGTFLCRYTVVLTDITAVIDQLEPTQLYDWYIDGMIVIHN